MIKLNGVTKAGAVFLLWAAMAVALPAQNFTTLHTFVYTDGAYPGSTMTQGVDGSFYGTTSGGGATDYGIFFKITSEGVFTDLYSFCPDGIDCPGGGGPNGLVLGADGNFYGTANGKGDSGSQAGTVFKLTSEGVLTALYSFCSQSDCTDGALPDGGLVRGADGDFYGTTRTGGDYNKCTNLDPPGCGTIFKITPSGTLTTLHRFNGADGADPFANLVQATDGNFYGTTYSGGSFTSGCYLGQNYGCGTVFKITPSGTLTTLYNFCAPPNSCADGANPTAGLIQGTEGNLYGTATGGGAYGAGTVFKITLPGTLAALASFDYTDGSAPWAGLVQGSDGNLYGTTQYGGANNSRFDNIGSGDGTIFEVTTGGVLTTLYSFNATDGQQPFAGLLQATNGKFYGTTSLVESGCCGTVFGLGMGLGPFVTANPAAGRVGAKVGILGTNLTGATSVIFNGTQAAFRVVSKTLIEAKIPSGATAGRVYVQLPSGTLSSNVPFIVLN
jgi:uncharacterized repeat protein (TIGR03803 family)